jgi:hypothetical protein
MSFSRHRKIYQSDGPKGDRTDGSASLGDHRSDESSTGYSFAGCSPAEPTSASPAITNFSQHPAAVNCSAAKRNLSPFLLSQLRGPLQGSPFCHRVFLSPGFLLAFFRRHRSGPASHSSKGLELECELRLPQAVELSFDRGGKQVKVVVSTLVSLYELGG